MNNEVAVLVDIDGNSVVLEIDAQDNVTLPFDVLQRITEYDVERVPFHRNADPGGSKFAPTYPRTTKILSPFPDTSLVTEIRG